MPLTSKRFPARFIILATGATPMTLPIHGIEHVIDSSAFLELDDLPKRIIFIGGGFISFEFAHFAVRLGRPDITAPSSRPVRVPLDRLMHKWSAFCRTPLPMKGSIFTVRLPLPVSKRQTRDLWSAPKTVIRLKRIWWSMAPVGCLISTPLIWTGPGIEHSGRGINVDPHMLTTNSTVYAIGDCARHHSVGPCGGCRSTGGSGQHSQPAKQHGSGRRHGLSAVPAVLFTYPQYGMVGKTEQALKDEGVKYRKSAAQPAKLANLSPIGVAFSSL